MAKSKSIYQGRILDIRLENATLPDGQSHSFELVRHPGGAVVAAVDGQHRICLLRQYRYAIDQWIWELPAGILEAGEPPLEAAKRELHEETGVHAKEWHALGSVLSTPGFCDERLFIFLAQGITQGEAHPEAQEFLEVHWLTLENALSMVEKGQIDDAKTIVGLFKVRYQLLKGDL